MKHITHKLIIMLFMLMMAGGASAQKGFFGSISRSKGVEYFYTASVSRGNPNTNRGVPKIKGIDAEYLVVGCLHYLNRHIAHSATMAGPSPWYLPEVSGIDNPGEGV